LSDKNSIVADGPALKYKNILIVRTDRIGDVVLTLPMIRVLRKNFPLAQISFLARSYTNEIVEGQPDLDRVILYDKEGTQKRFLTMLSELHGAEFDLAIVAFPRFRIASLLWLSGVKVRVGTGYRWYSFLFNKRVYEHRRTGERHEFEYNLSLLRELGCEVDPQIVPSLAIQQEALTNASEERKRLGVSSKDILVILHPGSGGSARDWSPDNFASLALKLTNLGWKVVVTGAKGEEELVRRVADGSGRMIGSSVGVLSLKGLAAFISSADLLVANSTGPLHIAAAVGTPVIGFYPPMIACSPQRWGPVTERKILFVPELSQCELCHGGACRSNVCMDQIKVQDVVDAAQKLVKKKTRNRKSIRSAVYS
jgi:lipopolysaccharide heptosyltransferase II